MTEYRFMQPLDVLYLRGNKLFEGAGAHGQALMPPWPSVAAGALRSRMLADAQMNFAAFGRGEPIPDESLARSLGTPAHPGDFHITCFTIAQQLGNIVEPCIPLPADVVVCSEALDNATYLRPTAMNSAITGSYPLGRAPVLARSEAGKPITGLWLNTDGWRAYMAGRTLKPRHLLKREKLWQTDPRVGIALEAASGTAGSGMLYTAETVALARHTGFLAGIAGADGLVPESGLLRLGGDGHGATLSASLLQLPQPDWDHIADERRFRIVLATPGLFAAGWRLPGLDSDNRWHGPGGITARLTSACVQRAEVVSGWDLARRGPKPAQQIAPVGAVYFLDELDGSAEVLRSLTEQGLWPLIDDNALDLARRAEGFNNVFIAAWPQPR